MSDRPYKRGELITLNKGGVCYTARVIRDDGARVRVYLWLPGAHRWYHQPETHHRTYARPFDPAKSPTPDDYAEATAQA